MSGNENDSQGTEILAQQPNSSFEVMSNDSSSNVERREEIDIDRLSFTKSDTSETLSQKLSAINPPNFDHDVPSEKQSAPKQKKEIHLQNYNLEETTSEIREESKAQDRSQQPQASQQPQNNTGPTSSGESNDSAVLDVCNEAYKGNFLPAIRCLTLEIMPKDYIDASGYHIIHHAISYNNFDVTLLLLDHFKIDVNIKSKAKQTCLMTAASFGNIEMMKILLDRGAKIDEQDETRFTAALYALRQNHLACLFYLIAKGANLSLGDANGCTVVHWAAFRNNVFLLKFFVRLGLNLNATDSYGLTPLQRAISSEAVEAVKYLLCDLKMPLPENYSVDQIQHVSLKNLILKHMSPEKKGFWERCQSKFYEKSPQYTFWFYAINLALGLLFYCQACLGEYELSYIYHIIFMVFGIYFLVYTYWYFLRSSDAIPKLKKFAYSKLGRHDSQTDSIVTDSSGREMTPLNRYKHPYIDNLIAGKAPSQTETPRNPEYPYPSFLHEIYFNVENGEFDKALLFEEKRYCPTTLILKKAKTKYCKHTQSLVEGFHHYSHILKKPIDTANHPFYLLLLVQQTSLLFMYLLANLILFYDRRLSSIFAIIPETIFLLIQKTSIFAGIFLAIAFCYFGYSLVYTLIELFCVAKNLTYHELLKPYKYPYLYTINRSATPATQMIKIFSNPYDRGVVKNVCGYIKRATL